MKNEKLVKNAKRIDVLLRIWTAWTILLFVCGIVLIPITLFMPEQLMRLMSSLSIGELQFYFNNNFKDLLNLNAFRGVYGFVFFMASIYGIISYLGIKELRLIIAPMKEGHPFEEGISKRLKRLGWLVLIGGGLSELALMTSRSLQMQLIPLDKLFNTAYISSVHSNHVYGLSFLLIALLLFFLGYIFRYGEELQKESDETL